MAKKFSILALSLMAGLAAVPALVAAAPASAEQLVNRGVEPMDPILAYGEAMAPQNEFFLNSSDDMEVVRFKHAHDLSICIPAADPDAAGAARHAYPVTVSYDAQTDTVAPGDCRKFTAQRVSVRPATMLPDDVILTGTVNVLK